MNQKTDILMSLDRTKLASDGIKRLVFTSVSMIGNCGWWSVSCRYGKIKHLADLIIDKVSASPIRIRAPPHRCESRRWFACDRALELQAKCAVVNTDTLNCRSGISCYEN